MTKRFLFPFLGLCLLILTPKARANFLMEGSLGTAYSLPSEVHIYQDGEATLHFLGTWSNETFRQAPYYAIRLGGWTQGPQSSGWEFENIHHKVVLNNNPPEVQNFKATFGFNFFLLNRAWDLKWLILRLGVGPIIAHPITTVRGEAYNSAVGGILGSQYFLVGAGLQLSVQRRFYLGKHFFLSAEGKMTAAWANLPVARGTSQISNVAFHILGGTGYLF